LATPHPVDTSSLPLPKASVKSWGPIDP